MGKILRWVFGGRDARVIDLPLQFGERLRIGAVRDAFRDQSHAETIRAVAQILWMQRVAAAEEAMDAALDGKTDAKFHLGQMAAIDNALAEFAGLMAGKGTEAQRHRGTENEAMGRLRKWFLE